MATVAEVLAAGFRRHQAGRLEEAASVYDQVLKFDPGQADALHLLGVVRHQQGDNHAAVALIERAIAANDGDAAYHHHLGNALAALGAVEAASAAYARAIARHPGFAEPHNRLGTLLQAQGNDGAAREHFVGALACDPNHFEARYNLAALDLASGRPAEAAPGLRAAAVLRPDLIESYISLGVIARGRGAHDRALPLLRRALAVHPSYGRALANLGAVLNDLAAPEAAETLRRARAAAPNATETHHNLAVAEFTLGRLGAAQAAICCALVLEPDNAERWTVRGAVRQGGGDLGGAGRAFARALALDPSHPKAGSNRLFCLSYDPRATPAAIRDVARAWGRVRARATAPAFLNERVPDRRLRVGYLSADLRRHAVANNLIGLIEAHDPRAVEVACYAEVAAPDEMTARFRAAAALWRTTVGLDDAAVAELIRRDRIDILVVVAGHTGENRLAVAALRPAPVQITFLDIATSGLPEIDHWLIDRRLHPADSAELIDERPLEVPVSMIYEPPADAPEPGTVPSLNTGRVTFGSFHNPAKLNDDVLALWARVLRAVPGAELRLGFQARFDDPGLRRHVSAALAGAGVDPARLVFEGGRSARAGHLARLDTVDIVLDPFPFGGCNATFEALWMGVPVVTLPGERWLSRMSAAFLHHAGLDDLVAPDAEAYVAIAAALAADVARRVALRATLRGRLRASLVCDAAGHARAVERAYLAAWRGRLGAW